MASYDQLPEGSSIVRSDDDVAPSYDTLPSGSQIVRSDDDDSPTQSADTNIPSGVKVGNNPWDEATRAAFRGPTDSHTLPGLAEIAATGVANIPSAAGNAAIDLGSRMFGFGTENNHVIPEFSPGEAGKEVISDIANSDEGKAVARGAAKADQWVGNTFGATTQDVLHQAGSVAGDVANVLPGVAAAAKVAGPVARWAKDLPVGEGTPTPATPHAEVQETPAVAPAGSRQSIGAAAASPSLAGTSTALQQAVANAANPDMDAVERHVNAETLPMPEGETPEPLTRGQAARDAQQRSDEIDKRGDPDTQGILSASMTNQDATLGKSMGEIRRRATPDIVQRTTTNHGQTAIDEIKTVDNENVLDTRTKYKALADAANGAMPIDTGTAIDEINTGLTKKLLTTTASGDKVISEIMDNLKSGKPMPFETFHSALSNLAALQRTGTPAGAAATIVRKVLEDMPLTPESAHLKGLRDAASASAKHRFDTIDQNPAYEAVIEDNVPKDPKTGLHVIGKDSPLAPVFMDRYFTGGGGNAAPAYVARMQGVMSARPEFSRAVEASSLNELRDAAGLDKYDSGIFKNDKFQKARAAMDDKAHLLMRPETLDNVDHLKRYSEDVNWTGKANTINRSNTALTLQRHGAIFPGEEVPISARREMLGNLADWTTDLAAAHSGPVGYAAKKIGSSIWRAKTAAQKDAYARLVVKSLKDAKLKFAQDATAPGAGIEKGAAPPIARASGGRVDHEVLVNRLMDRWHAARKNANLHTENLLNLPDEAITKALRVANSSAMP